MAGAFDDDALDFVVDYSALVDEKLPSCLFARQHEHRHGQLCFGELGKVLAVLLKRLEHFEAGAHRAGLMIGLGVKAAITLRHGFFAVGSKVVPEMFEIDSFAAGDELERSLTVKMKMPEIA